MQNYHILRVQYHGPTNSSGSKVSIRSDRFEQRITVPYDHTYNNATDIAAATLKRLGYAITGQGEGPEWDYIISTTFEGPRDMVKAMKARARK